MYKKVYFLLLVNVLLVACAEQTTRSESMIPVEDRHVPIDDTYASESTITNRSNIEKAEPTVIASLISEADKHAATGKTDMAIASIERALRIEPGNALLWNRFASLRLQQQNWQQAIVLAKKSNALASNDASLKAANWDIIARAYESMGDLEKAREARKQQRLTG